ncbi:MAG: hypothetical protein SGPRY_000085 [Prymnesium sp.]
MSLSRSQHSPLHPRHMMCLLQEVGAPIVYTMVLQVFFALFIPLLPGVEHWRARRAWSSKFTLGEMIKLHTRPEPNLPIIVGKAYAFLFVTTIWGGAMPLLYLLGMLFFLSASLVHRYVMLRLHCHPPVYSPSLLYKTLWWVEPAVFFKLLATCWAYANVPSEPFGADQWTAPFGNSTSSASLVSSLLGDSTALAGLDGGYNIGGHINSNGTLMLMMAAIALVGKIALDRTLTLLSHLLPVPRNSGLVAKRCARHAHATPLFSPALALPSPHATALNLILLTLPPPFPSLILCSSRVHVEEQHDADVHFTDQLEIDGDPNFTKALEGVDLSKAHPITIPRSSEHTIFTLLGLQQPKLRLSAEEWLKDASPLHAHLSGAHNVSYEPEHSPLYAKAYEYMTPAHVFEENRADDMSARAAQPQAWDPDDDVSDGSTDSSEVELTTEAKYYLAMQRGKIRN